MTPFEEYKALKTQSERALAAKDAEIERLQTDLGLTRAIGQASQIEIDGYRAEIARLEELVAFYRKAFPTEADMAQRAALKGSGS
jgi:hypothetical protein